MYALVHPERAEGLIYLSGPGLSNDRQSVWQRRMARLLPHERCELEEGEPSYTRWAHLLWATDFADRANCPDFEREPLYSYPISVEVSSSLRADADRVLADPTLREQAGW